MTRTELAALLAARGLAPRKRAGQNFLCDANALAAIVRDADLPPRAMVFEIGPGPGLLTTALLGAGHRVVAVEIDRGLARICRERHGADPRFSLVEGDVLEGRTALNPAVLDLLRGAESFHVVANLPYNIASTILLLLWEGDLPIATSTTLVQLEAAERLVAPPDSEAYGHLSVLLQLHATGRITRRFPPRVFWPEPKVDSAVVRLTRASDRPSREEYGRLKPLVKSVFQHRRKTLVHTLKGRDVPPDRVREALLKIGLPADARPERLSPAEFRTLAACLSVAGRHA